MPTYDKIFCECCGRSAEDVLITMEFSKDGGQQIACEMCSRFIKDGLLRAEYEGGKKYWRRWTYNIQPMTPTEHRTLAAFPPQT